MAKKKGKEKKKKQKTVHDPNRNHQAHAKDSAQVLKRAVQSSGLNGARIVAKKLDEQGRDGTATLMKLMTHHQEPMTGTDKLEWVAGPASWMREAMVAEAGKNPQSQPKLIGRALSRHMRRLRLKQLEMKKAQAQQPPTPSAQ